MRITLFLFALIQLAYCDVFWDGRVTLDNNQILQNDVKPGQVIPPVVIVQQDGTQQQISSPLSTFPTNSNPISPADTNGSDQSSSVNRKSSLDYNIVTTVAITITAIGLFVLAAFGFQKFCSQEAKSVTSVRPISDSNVEAYDKEHEAVRVNIAEAGTVEQELEKTQV
jgi:hypothetical protein